MPPFHQYLPGEPGVYGEKFSGRTGTADLVYAAFLKDRTGSALNVDKAPPARAGIIIDGFLVAE